MINYITLTGAISFVIFVAVVVALAKFAEPLTDAVFEWGRQLRSKTREDERGAIRLGYKLVILLVVFWIVLLFGLLGWGYVSASFSNITDDTNTEEPAQSPVQECQAELGIERPLANLTNPPFAECLASQCSDEETCEEIALELGLAGLPDGGVVGFGKSAIIHFAKTLT